MTDAELIAWLSEKAPRDFTAEEVALLRERAAVSPEVRAAIHDAIEMESDLVASLADVQLPVDQLWQRAEDRQRQPPSPRRSPAWWKWIGLATCILLAVGWWGFMNSQKPRPGEVIVNSPPPTKPPSSTEPSNPIANPIPAQTPPAVPEAEPVAAREMVKPASPDRPVPTQAAGEAGPWDDWLTSTARPWLPAHPQLWGDLAQMGLSQLTVSDFETWWRQVPGRPYALSAEQFRGQATVQFQGWAQLRAPWVADSSLRFVTFEVRDLTLYFWQGDEGIALRYYTRREPHVWAAYHIRRVAGEREPNSWGLLTTDSGAFFRSGAHVWDVSANHGRLELVVAGTTLLSVPAPAKVEEVNCEGHTRLRGFRWSRVATPATVPVTPAPSVLAVNPADWDWQIPDASAAMLQRQADGSVTLTSTSRTEPTRVYVTLPQYGLYAAEVQVAAADPGTSIYLGNEAGEPFGQLAFSRDRRTQQVAYLSLPPRERRDDSEFALSEAPPPYFVPGQWLKLTAGLGTWHTLCSADAQHYGHVMENPLRDVRGAVRSIGLLCWPSETPRTITLKAGAVRRLEGIYQLADGLPAPAPDASLTPETSWWTSGWQQFSVLTDPERWWNGWAIATLERGPSRELADDLLRRLAESSRSLSTEQRAAALDDLLVLSDHWSEDRSVFWAREYARLRSPTPLSDAPSALGGWQEWLQAPDWSQRGHRDVFVAPLLSDLLQSTAAEDWSTASTAAVETQVWLATGHPDQPPRERVATLDQVARWSKTLASEALARTGGPAGDVLPVGWRHPLVLPVNKEAYNVFAELRSALSAQEWRDACRIISSMTPQAISGLLPSANDPQLALSLDAALDLASQHYPELNEHLQRELTPAGWLRVTQAMNTSDVAALESVAMQYWGTPPGSAARMWLGDRAMSLGDSIGALIRYRDSRRWATAELQGQLAPRLQLAAGLAGLPDVVSTDPASPPVSDALLTDETVAASLNNRGPSLQVWGTAASSAPSSAVTLQPARYRWDVLARFDGQSGQNAGRGEYRESDAFGRQFAAALDDRHFYLSNRFQVNAYERATGKPVWAQGLGSEQGEAHAVPFTPMPPVIAGEALFVRRLAKSGVELACLDRLSGQVRWTVRPGEKANIVTDAVVLGDRAWVIVAEPGEQDQLELRWTSLSTRTGDVISAQPLIRLRNAWDGQVPLQLTATGTDMIVVGPGLVLHFDLEGKVHWLRRELWLPPEIDPLTHNELLVPPVVQGDRIILSAPHSRRILCLSAQSGQIIWSHPLSDLQGIVHVDAQLVLAATPDSLVAVDAISGQRRWQCPLDRFFGTIRRSEKSVWAMTQRPRNQESGWLQLVEIDADTGAILCEIPWDLPEAEDWRFGPWWDVDGEEWALAGRNWRESQRDLVRLSAIPTDSVAPDPLPALRPWEPRWTPDIQRALQILLPGWQLYGVRRDRLKLSSSDIHGETAVVTCMLEAQKSAIGVRQLSGAAGTLVIQVGQEPGQVCHWEIKLAGQVLAAWTSAESNEVWSRREIAIPAAEIGERFLQITATAAQKPATIHWKSLTIRPAETSPAAPVP